MSNKTLFLIIIGIIVVCAAAASFFYWQQTKPLVVTDQQIKDAQEKEKNQDNQPMAQNQCVRNFDENKFKNDKVAVSGRQVEIDVKNFGKIKLSFDEKAAPKTVENFLKLVNAGFYDCLSFHRVVSNFVVQGGDPEGTGRGGPGYTVPAEIKLNHKRGSVAMARLGDEANPKRESSGSQFYVALKDLPQLDNQYTVFGQVIEGMDIVDAIGQIQTNPPGDGSPVTPIIMQSVKIIK